MRRIGITLLLIVMARVPAHAQRDPADSVYRVARTALNNGDYGRAARLFSDLSKAYPSSAYVAASAYYEATARYRIGTIDELQAAARLLQVLVDKPRGSGDAEAAALYAQVNGALARRGDRDAADKLAKSAQAGGHACDAEENQVRIAALNALSQLDVATSTPILRSTLERRDECSASLRRSAVFMLGRRSDAEAASLLIGVAKSDPDIDVRTAAIDALSRSSSEPVSAALEDLLRRDPDERIQRAVVAGLMRSENPKTRGSMRALVDRKDAAVSLRAEAIRGFGGERATAEDAAYLRRLYTAVDNDNLKRAIIDAVSRIRGPESEQWLLALAKNPNESSQLRSDAIARVMRLNLAIAEIAKLYDAADSYNVRSQLINQIKARRENEAAEKLYDIVKTGTDQKLKLQALNALMSRGDPRSQQLVLEIIKP